MKLRSEHSKSLRTLEERCKTVDANNKGIREKVTNLEHEKSELNDLLQSMIAKNERN
jgi:hypothetical protein